MFWSESDSDSESGKTHSEWKLDLDRRTRWSNSLSNHDIKLWCCHLQPSTSLL